MRTRTTFHAAAASAAVLVAAAGAGAQQTIEWTFAQVNQSLQGALFDGDPLVGMQVVNTRIYLNILVEPGSNAADLHIDRSFPLIPEDGAGNVLVLEGAELGWSGSGTFNYFLETTGFNGTLVAGRWGAETYGVFGELLEGSRIEMDVVPAPGAAAVLGLAGVATLRRRRR